MLDWFYCKKLYCIINKKCAFCWFKKCVMSIHSFKTACYSVTQGYRILTMAHSVLYHSLFGLCPPSAFKTKDENRYVTRTGWFPVLQLRSCYSTSQVGDSQNDGLTHASIDSTLSNRTVHGQPSTSCSQQGQRGTSPWTAVTVRRVTAYGLLS